MTGTPELDRAIAAAGELTDALRELKGRFNPPSTPVNTPLEGDALARHRAAHKPGLPGRIESDPELRTFILDRIETRTFDALVAEIAAAFPPARQVRRSSLHRWWQLHGRAALANR